MRGKGFVPGLEEPSILVPEDEAHVGDGSDELVRSFEVAGVDEMGPPRPRDLKLLVDRDRFFNRDTAVRIHGRVVEFAQCAVAGARVVPRVRGLERRPVKSL